MLFRAMLNATRPANPPEKRLYRFKRCLRWVAVSGLLVALLAAAISWWEWYQVGVQADPSTIAAYHFGSEPMIVYGGDHYRSADAYSSRMFMIGLSASTMAAAIVYGLYRCLWSLPVQDD